MARLWINGEVMDMAGAGAEASLLEFVRNQPGLTGTKEGCASGDCGACTVLAQDLADPCRAGAWFSLNSCLAPAAAFANHHVVTVEGLSASSAALHPVQAAMVAHHASQCGFCTPGFVMALTAHQLAAGDALPGCKREDFLRAISGNLCRCTGYRAILAAAADAAERTALGFAQPADAVAALAGFEGPDDDAPASDSPVFLRPVAEAELQQRMADAPPAFRFVAGATDLWLEVTQRQQPPGTLIDVSRVAELRGVELKEGQVCIGGAATQAALMQFFGASGRRPCLAIEALMERFGSPQIRHRATLGGNIANASPVADWPPVLMALDAQLELADCAGRRRWLPIEGFYTAYKSTLLRQDEYLRAIAFDDAALDALQVCKLSKRRDDDIASVLGAFRVDVYGGRFRNIRVAFGGVAATPVRLRDVEAGLEGAAANAAAVDAAAVRLRAAVKPISDVRASRAYRLAMAEQTLRNALHGAIAGEVRQLKPLP